MKIFKKLSVVLLVSMSVLVVAPVGANAEWRQNNSGWWYSEGTSYSIGWRQIDGNWYYFDFNGYMKTGWQFIDESWYYFFDDGTMASDTNVPGGAVGADGKWISLSTYNFINDAKTQLAEEESLKNYGGGKVIYDWYSESDLENQGISVDRSDLNFDFDFDDSDTGFKIITTVKGTLKLKNFSTKTVIKSIKFNDTLTSKDIKDGYYEIVKDGLTMKIENGNNYNIRFSGNNLVSLGILK